MFQHVWSEAVRVSRSDEVLVEAYFRISDVGAADPCGAATRFPGRGDQ